MYGFAGAGGFYIALAGTDGFDRSDESGKHRRLRDRDIVRTQYYLEIWRERGNLLDRSNVSVQIRFRPIEPDRAGIVSVAGEKQSVVAIEKADGVGRVAGSGDNLRRDSL